MDAVERARRCVDDFLGEGPIAFPELLEALVRDGVPDREAVSAAKLTLGDYFAAERIAIHRGRALDEDLLDVTGDEARRMIADQSAYQYGDGDEVRAWFSVPA